MSSFIMDERATATLANSLEYIMNSGFNRFGFDAPASLHEALSNTRDRYGFYTAGYIFARLYDLNDRAASARCKTEPTPKPDFPEVPPLIEERQRENRHEKLLPWHYKFCKLLDCLLYQASEDATRNDPLFLALLDFSRTYKVFLVTNTDEYHAAPWGSI